MEATAKTGGAMLKAVVLGVVITTISMVIFSKFIAPMLAKKNPDPTV